jgi:hypothetical protein
MQKFLIPSFSLVIAITAFFIALRAWLRSRNQKRYIQQSREHWEEIKRGLPTSRFIDPALLTKTVPNLYFTVRHESNGMWSINFSGNIDEVSDLFARVIRENKEVRDMIKSAFRKSGKALG